MPVYLPFTAAVGMATAWGAYLTGSLVPEPPTPTSVSDFTHTIAQRAAFSRLMSACASSAAGSYPAVASGDNLKRGMPEAAPIGSPYAAYSSHGFAGPSVGAEFVPEPGSQKRVRHC